MTCAPSAAAGPRGRSSTRPWSRRPCGPSSCRWPWGSWPSSPPGSRVTSVSNSSYSTSNSSSSSRGAAQRETVKNREHKQRDWSFRAKLFFFDIRSPFFLTYDHHFPWGNHMNMGGKVSELDYIVLFFFRITLFVIICTVFFVFLRAVQIVFLWSSSTCK